MESDDIAIVGAGCRFPGADNLEEFWRVLLNGENHVKEIPLDRWNNEAFYDADKNVKGKSYVTKAGLLNNHDRWDNRLFGISDNEATQVDPQQRYVLECVHMAMEDAGITRAQLNGTNTGVMIGCMNDDYKVMLNLDSPEYTSYSATGMSTSVISARVSYVFNLHGTCLTLDTACSSALVAIHLAGQSLKTGDCDAVICGGVSSIINPDTFIPLCQAKMMSTFGQCQTFCDTADGYARGEGCGIVILKRLKDALRDGNKIWGLIQTGSNQDGCMTKPITAPSGIQQTKLLKQLYQTYNVDPASIEYIEAHGTGTPRGDPTEINALGEFFVSHRKQHQMTKPLLIGSVKSNIGHTESAAGIAGLLKILLMMKHGKIVPSLHVKPDKSNVNKKIRLQELDLDIAAKVEDWNDTEGKKIACLNSFGFGGSNAHAVVKQMPNTVTMKGDIAKPVKVEENETVLPICVSAIDRDSLKHNLLTFQKDLESHDIPVRDISHTSLYRRDIYSYRTLLFGKDRRDIQNDIQTKVHKLQDIQPKKDHNIIFVFCGVGTTWTGMCQELMAQNETFRETIRNIDEFLFPLAGWKIGDKLSSSTDYDEPFLNHIAIFSVQVALSRMWKAFGVQPDVIVGQSVGEVAAACVANLLSLEEAVNIIYHRSKILAQQSVGTMMVVGNMDIADIDEHCRQLDNKVTVAVYSSPKACTLSGHEVDLKELKQQIEEDADKNNKSVLIKELGVRCAYHSKLVEPCTDEIRCTIDTIFQKSKQSDIESNLHDKQVPLISTVTGHKASLDEVRTGAYWANNVRMPVKFMQGISESLTEVGMNLFLEIGPRPVLRAHLPAIMGDQTNAMILPSLLANRELSRVHSTLTEIFEGGIDLDWRNWLPESRDVNVADIPRYQFKRSTDLFFPGKVKFHLAGIRNESNDIHMFIKKVPGTENFEILVNPTQTPFVYEHFLSGSVLIPGATYVEVGFKIGFDKLRKPVNQFSVNVEFASTFTPAPDKDYKLMVETTETDDGRISYNVKSENRTLAIGKIIDQIHPARQPLNIEMLKSRLFRRISKEEVYKSLADINFKYGPSLSLIQNAWASDTECLAEIHFSEDHVEELASTHFHPAIVDAIFQMFGILNRCVQFTVPKGVDSIKLTGPLEHHMYCYAKEIKYTDTSSSYNALLVSKSGTMIAEFQNFYTKAISGTDEQETELLPQKIHWTEVIGRGIEPKGESQNGYVVVFTSCNERSFLTELQTLKNVELLEEVNEFVLEKHLNRECMGIVYHVGQGHDGHRTGEEVFDGTVKRFMDVKLLLSGLSGRNSTVPLTVLTERTQSISGRNKINIDGAELWGMKRAVFHEGLHANCKLVDIDSDNVHTETLHHLLINTIPDNKEFQLVGSKLYEAKLKNNEDSIPSSWKLNIDQRATMHVSSSKPGKVHQPFFWKENNHQTPTEPKQSEMIQISLFASVLHDSSIYLPTLDMPVTDDTVWNDAGHTAGYQMLTLEGQGTMLNREKEEETEVIFCYPVPTATMVSVPQECIIRQEECMSYKNGLLIELNVLLNMIMGLPTGSDVVLISEHDRPGLCRRFCEEIAKERKLTITFCRLKDVSRKRKVSNSVDIILATAVKPIIIETIFQKYTSVRNLVSTQSMFEDCIQMWTNLKYPGTRLSIFKSVDMFSTKTLKNMMPNIRGFLRKAQRPEMGSIVHPLPMKDLNLCEMLQQKTVPFICVRESLFSKRGCYILIGGLTGLGWELLKLLAESGAGYIIPMSRRQPTADQSEKIASIMEAQSCHIHPLQVDIAVYTSVQKTFAEINSLFPGVPVRGILHGAGVLSDTLLVNQDKEKVAKVLTPKVLGSWNLHQASLNLPLDFFVMHSSIVSVIGNHGQCNYAAGNSFLDALAAYRHSIGLPAKSLNWGALAVGMAADNPETEKALRSRGFRSLQTDQIRKFFIDALMSNETNIVLADIDWDMLGSSPAFMSQKSKYDSLITSVKQTRHDTSTDLSMDMSKLVALEPSERQKEILTILKSIVNDVFVVDKSSITLTTSLVAIGVDSMQAMSFSNKLIDMFGCQIPLISLLSEQTTLANIVETIMDKIQSTKVIPQDDKKNDEVEAEILKTKDGRELDLDYLFGSEDVTFMQIEVLEKNKTKKIDPSQVRISDAELENLHLDLDVWKMILKHVLQINPELRKLYSRTEDGRIHVHLVPADDVIPDIEIVDIHELASQHAYERKEDVTFHLEKDLPIRIRIAESETGTLFRIILHVLVADMMSTAVICKDIEKTMTCYMERKQLPSRKPTINIADVLKVVMKPKLHELHSFWLDYLNIPLTPVSVGSPVSKPNGEYYELSNGLVPLGTVKQIQKYIGQRGLSLYNFVMSVYQLFLHLETGANIVPVGTAVDMRYHVPELSQAITRCTNYIPVIAAINPGTSVDHFIEENSKNISTTTQHGAYPSLLIPKNLTNQQMKENIFRHTLVMNDVSALNGIEQANKIRAIQSKLTFETFLRVKYDLRKQWIELETGFNSEIVGFQKGENLPRDLVDLMEVCLKDGYKTIANILEQREATEQCPSYEEVLEIPREVNAPDEILAPPYREVEVMEQPIHIQTNGITNGHTIGRPIGQRSLKGRIVLIEGDFLKQTSQGWDHRVATRLVENDREGRLVLEWCKIKGKHRWNSNVRSLDIQEMLQIKLLTLNGLSAILMKSPRRWFVLKTAKHDQAQQWMTEITMAMQK